MSPLNAFTLPLIPFGVFMGPSPKLNNFVMAVQYIMLMMIMFAFFFIISAILLPFAYLKSLFYKMKKILQSKSTYEYAVRSSSMILFLITGVPTVLLTFLVDCIYFWKNNFKEEKDLKTIVILREPSTITNKSIKKIKCLCDRFTHSRIKAVYGVEYVRKFREDQDINSLLQFLIFG